MTKNEADRYVNLARCRELYVVANGYAIGKSHKTDRRWEVRQWCEDHQAYLRRIIKPMTYEEAVDAAYFHMMSERKPEELRNPGTGAHARFRTRSGPRVLMIAERSNA